MKSSNQDQSFDKITNKFEKNIYGSTKGRLRHELLFSHLQSKVPLHSSSLKILDAGGGTGVMSQALSKLGHRVVLTDISSDAIALAREKLNEYEHLKIIKTDILSLEDHKKYDLVVCHAVLEWLKNPKEVLEKLANLVKTGGYLSVSFFNLDAQLFGNMCYGNFDYVEQGMKTRNVVRLSPNNPQKPQEVLSWLADLPVNIIHKAGIRCFHDYLKDNDKQLSHYDQLKKLELKYGSSEPYMWLGKYFMIIAQK